MGVRHLFPVTRAWVERRDAAIRAEEEIFREARDNATGAEREFLDALIYTRSQNTAGHPTSAGAIPSSGAHSAASANGSSRPSSGVA